MDDKPSASEFGEQLRRREYIKVMGILFPSEREGEIRTLWKGVLNERIRQIEAPAEFVDVTPVYPVQKAYDGWYAKPLSERKAWKFVLESCDKD